jgi:hypothetical protein
MDPLSAPTKAKGRLPSTAWRTSSPMTPPWLTTTTRWSGCPATTRSSPARTRARKPSVGSAPGMASHRSSWIMRTAAGWPSATWWRKGPPSQSPRNTSRRSRSTVGSRPSRAARGAAVSAVRRSVVT